MKKRLLFVAAIFAATATFAQDGLTSKKGEAYLPEAGDWAIGIDANPFINYAGNLFNGNTGNNIGAGATWYGPNMSIYGKMFKDEKTAYIGMLRIGFGSNSQETVFEQTLPGATAPASFTNKTTNSHNDIVLGAGIEKRRGNTRIQGVYGAMLNIGFGGQSTKNEYGVGIAQDTVQAPQSEATARITEQKAGSTFNLGINGFIGVEWFFAPKVSLGAKYTWGLEMNSTGQGETTKEWWGTAAGAPAGTANSAQTKTTKTGSASDFSLDTGISGTSISLNFHF